MRSAPEANASASCAARASNLFGAVTNGCPVERGDALRDLFRVLGMGC